MHFQLYDMRRIKPVFRCVNHCAALHTSANRVSALCLHTPRLCRLPGARSVCLHTLSAHTGAPKGHMLISCELNLQQRKDNRSAQLTQKRKWCLRTHSHTRRLIAIAPAAEGALFQQPPPHSFPLSLSLCVCVSLFLEESCFVAALFSLLRALAFPRSNPSSFPLPLGRYFLSKVRGAPRLPQRKHS